MAGKPITRASRAVARVIDSLSKNTIADLLLDRIQGEIGDGAGDEEILANLQPTLDTVARLRGDKPVNLIGLLDRLAKSEQRYLADVQSRKDRGLLLAYPRSATSLSEKEIQLAEKVMELNDERPTTHDVNGKRVDDEETESPLPRDPRDYLRGIVDERADHEP